MRFRKLRIAWSVFWGLAAVLLIVLWVRSYFCNECIYRKVNRRTLFRSQADCEFFNYPGSIVYRYWYQGSDDAEISSSTPPWRYHLCDGSSPYVTEYPIRFEYLNTPDVLSIQLPHSAIVLAFGTACSIPWIRWRFTLRTLLIATTLVAVVLGLAVWVSR